MSAVLSIDLKPQGQGFWIRLWRDKPLGFAGAIALLLFGMRDKDTKEKA